MIGTNQVENKVIDTEENTDINFLLKKIIIMEAVKQLKDPFKNLTVEDVAKDLKMGLNLANDLFKQKSFPSVNIGKQKTITLLAYILWKMEKQENINKGKKSNG